MKYLCTDSIKLIRKIEWLRMVSHACNHSMSNDESGEWVWSQPSFIAKAYHKQINKP